MGSVPATDNKLADFLVSIAKAATSGGETAVEAAILVYCPELANPFCKYILDELVSYFGGLLDSNVIDPLVIAAVIDIQTNGEKSKVYAALKALSQKPGDANANQNADAAWDNLIRSDGSAKP